MPLDGAGTVTESPVGQRVALGGVGVGAGRAAEANHRHPDRILQAVRQHVVHQTVGRGLHIAENVVAVGHAGGFIDNQHDVGLFGGRDLGGLGGLEGQGDVVISVHTRDRRRGLFQQRIRVAGGDEEGPIPRIRRLLDSGFLCFGIQG